MRRLRDLPECRRACRCRRDRRQATGTTTKARSHPARHNRRHAFDQRDHGGASDAAEQRRQDRRNPTGLRCWPPPDRRRSAPQACCPQGSKTRWLRPRAHHHEEADEEDRGRFDLREGRMHGAPACWAPRCCKLSSSIEHGCGAGKRDRRRLEMSGPATQAASTAASTTTEREQHPVGHHAARRSPRRGRGFAGSGSARSDARRTASTTSTIRATGATLTRRHRTQARLRADRVRRRIADQVAVPPIRSEVAAKQER